MMDPYLVLYAAMLLLFGAAFVMTVLLKRHALLGWPLTGVVATLDFLFLGLLVLDLIRLYAADVRPETLAYRWVLYPAAILLLESSALVLWVYGEHAGADHAKEYRWAVLIGIIGSFAAFLGLALHPLFA